MPARLALLACVFLVACGSSSITTSADAPSGSADVPLPLTADAPPGAVVDAPPFQFNDAGKPLCVTQHGDLVVCQCSDGLDNDNDTFIDGLDPECSGPFDNDESSYWTGIPGDNQDPFVQDCFFDGDSGGGNDGCRWDIRCVLTDPNPQHCNNNQLDGCGACKQITPNGCDCFGCCTVFVPSDGGLVSRDVRIIDTCTAADLFDNDKCPACTKVEACQNPCDVCEYCLGRPPDPSCTPDAGAQCAQGVEPCPPSGDCGAGFSCITGCCLKYIP